MTTGYSLSQLKRVEEHLEHIINHNVGRNLLTPTERGSLLLILAKVKAAHAKAA